MLAGCQHFILSRGIFVRSGFVNMILGKSSDNTQRILLWANASAYRDSSKLDSISGLDAFGDGVVTSFAGHSRFWGFSLRCLAIE